MRKMRCGIGLLGLAALLLGAVSVQAQTWDAGGGADTAFSQALNWDTDTLPLTTDYANISMAVTATHSAGETNSVYNCNFNGGSVFNMSGGKLSLTKAGNTKRCAVGSNSGTGTFNQSGGRFDVGHILVIGWGVQGDYNLSGGEMIVGRGGTSLQGSGASTSISIGPSSGAGTLNISGGSLKTRVGVEIGPNAAFNVSGTAASQIGIGSNGSGDGFWYQLSGATLGVGVGPGGVTKILIDDEGDDGGAWATFADGALLDVDYYDGMTYGGTWTVLEVEGTNIVDNGLAFAPGVDTDIWSFAIDNSGANGKLTVTAVGDAAPVAPREMVGYWNFDETSGATAADETGSFDGTVSGTATWTEGMFGNALAFNGTDTSVAVGNALESVTNELTIAFWCYGDPSLPNEMNAFSGGSGRDLNCHFPWSGGGTYGRIYFDADSPDLARDRMTLDINTTDTLWGGWNHWIFTKNVTNGTMTMYVNGEQAQSGTGKTNHMAGIDSLFIGSDRGSQCFYHGLLDEFRVYNYELSDDEIFSVSRPSWHVEAEEWDSMSGVKTEDTSDLGGGLDVGWINDGDWMEYTINVETTGLYKIEFRVASNGGDGTLNIVSGGETIGSVYVGATGGWQSWETKSAYVEFPATGTQTLRLECSVPSGGFNINWFSYEPLSDDAVSLSVGSTRNQMMRYGIDYERLWYWYGSGLAPVPDWSVNDCNVDYIRTAVVGGYELEEATNSASVGNYDLSVYTQKVIPMMTAMQEANPNIKWFASPRPLNESYSNKKWEGENVTWQPYPIWVTGATTPISGDYDFNDIKCAQYLIRYLRLMKHYGFKISYIDLTNEWQSNVSGGKITQSDARDVVEYMKAYIEDPSSYQAEVDPTGHYAANYPELEPGDMPLTIAPSSWNYQQGTYWISNLNTDAKKDAIDIAASHNTDKTGTAQAFADQVHETLGADTEIWETEQHGWKGNSSTSEAMSFSYMIETIRAGFTGLSGWLAIGTTSQGHCYLLNNGSTVTRNVKYYMFKKLSNTSNYGYALDIDQTDDLTSTMALIRENLLTIWVINTASDTVLAEFDISGHSWDGSEIVTTRWDEDLSINGDETPEGIEGVAVEATASSITVALDGRATYCIEIPLVDTEDNFPFVQAESYTSGSGVSVQSCSDTDGGEMVAFSAAGDGISFDLDITKTYTNDVAFRVSSESANIAFDVYDGTNLVASVDRVATGGAQSWTTVYTSLPVDGGPMTLSIVATGGGWNLNWMEFDMEYYSSDTSSELVNLALNQSYFASNVYQDNTAYGADKAFDGSRSSRWATDTAPASVGVDFSAATTLNAFSMYEYGNRTTAFKIQYSDDGVTWYTAYEGGNPEDDVVYYFPTVTAQMFRYQSITSSGSPSIYEIEFYYDAQTVTSDPAVAAMSLDGNSLSLEWSGVEGATYSLQKSTNLVDGFTTIESGIPIHDATNINTVATPDDAAFYRVILED